MPVSTMDELAKEMGIAPEQVHTYHHNYVLSLLQRGVLADIDIGYFRAKTGLSAQDLGIEMSEEEKKYVSLGHQRLLPPELMQRAERAEGRGRSNLEKHTIGLLLGRFLPVTAATSFREANAALMVEFFGVRDEIVTRYDELKSSLGDEFKVQGEAAWERLPSKPQEPKSAWLLRFVRELLAKIPPKEYIQKSFYWHISYNFVPLPSTIQEEALRQEKLRKEQSLLHFESEDRKRQMEQMNAEVVAQLRVRQEETVKQTSSFLDETVSNLRSVVLETCKKAVVSIDRNDGKVLGSNVKQLRNLVDRVKLLNFYNDTEVAEFSASLEAHLDRKGTSKMKSIKALMEDMREAMQKSVRSIEREGTKAQEMARIIGKDIVKSARRVE